MYPRQLPPDCRSNAERKVFCALRDLVPDDYTAFYSTPMYRKSQSHGGLGDGEIDFLLAHPDHGLVVVEVKGGGIAHEAATQQWFSTDFSGERHCIKDPFEQAKGYKYLLRDDLRSCPLTRKFRYPLAHAVWFPDVDLTRGKLGLSVQIEKIVLDSCALDAAEIAIPDLFHNGFGEKPQDIPGGAGLNAIVDYLAPHWAFAPTLSAKFHDENREISEATKGQYRVLSLLSRLPRALVTGCAGSGKTVLALEKAHRVAASGGKVLILCFNKKLAKWLQRQTVQGVVAHHFHGFCAQLCREVGHAVPSPDPQSDSSSFFEHELPEALMDALAETEQRFDAVLVDEGQDFVSSWWIPIQEALADPVNGTFYIFFDDNQSIYTTNQELPFSTPLFPLSENCRNTQSIHKKVSRYYIGQDDIKCLGPEGRPTETIPAEGVLATLQNTVKRLVHQEGLNPSDIVVLSPVGQQRSEIQEGYTIGNINLSWVDAGSNRTVHCSTIHGFKGLESPVIILCELERVHAEKRNELLYIGMSRARNHLILIQQD